MTTAWSAYGPSVIHVDFPITPDRIVHIEREWTDGDDQNLVAMVKHGLSHADMAVHLNRDVEAIVTRLNALRNIMR
jgi:hypothetical protein